MSNYDDLIPGAQPVTKGPNVTGNAAAPVPQGTNYDDLVPGAAPKPQRKPITPPGNLVDPHMQAIVANRQNNEPIYPPNLDTQTGTPAEVRMIVGSAPAQDRLANLQKFYPDAKPIMSKDGAPTENYTFTDPKTGKLTLYNPLGADMGDLASVPKEAAQTVGAGLGGAVGGIESIPTFGAAAPVTVPIMAGVGAAAGGETWDAFAQHFLGQTDTRTLPQKLTEDAITAGTTALGSAGGALVGQAGKRLGKNVAQAAVGPDAPTVLNDMTQAGVTPSLGTVSGNRAVQGAQTVLGYYPSSMNVIGSAAQRNVDEVGQGVDNLITRYALGQETSPTRAGEALQRGAATSSTNLAARQGALYDNAYNMVGRDTPVTLDNTMRLYDQIWPRTAAAPDSLHGTASGLGRVEAVLRDATNPAHPQPLSFEELRAIRTEIGKELDDPVVAGSSGAANDVRRQLYAALTQDLDATAAAQGPDASHAVDLANRYTRFNMTQNAPVLQKVTDAGTPEQAFAQVFAGAKDGGTTLLRDRRNMPPQEWDVVAGTQLGQMGRAAPGVQNAAGDTFSINTFLTNWNKMSPEAKSATFDGTRYAALRPELDRLARVSDAVKGLSKLSNPSGTARVLLYGGAGASLLGFFTAPFSTAAAIAIPYGGARLMTSAPFVRWLVDASTGAAVHSPNGYGAQMGRLFAIARENPEIAKDVGQYAATLQQQQQPDQGQPQP